MPVTLRFTHSLAVAAALAFVPACTSTTGSAPPSKLADIAQRVAAPGNPTRLDFYASMHPDCTSDGDATVRIEQAPAHGTLSIVAGEEYSSYAPSNQRFECNKRKSPGLLAMYTAAAGYVGDDEGKVEIAWPNATVKTIDYKIRVGATALDQQTTDFIRMRTVAPGSAQRVDFVYSIDPACGTAGGIRFRVLKPPAHGSLSFEDGEGYTEFTRDNARYDCNKRKLPGTVVHYQSEAGFLGLDVARVEYAFPDQMYRTFVYEITVR